MWRNLSRGICRQSFKRSLCFENPDSNLKDGKSNQQRCCIKELVPCALQKLKLSICKEKRQNQKEETGNIGHHSFLEAFGWSGALVFGWVISKQIWLRYRYSCIKEPDFRTNRIVYDHNFVSLLSQIGLVKTQPPALFVLPQVPPHIDQSNEPISDLGEDEFEKAADELQAIHDKAMGQALNRRGILCLSKSTDAEAIKYFKRASELKYPPASFNMGQCCELGIGTKQDFKQAAEWYKIASDQGHPTAMYNLGVFYAHGWGELPADVNTARQLFTKAAHLGQPDAKAALKKESKHNVGLIRKPSSSSVELIKGHETKSPNLSFFVDNVRNGRGDNIYQKGCVPDNKWDVLLSSMLPVAI